jgi:hypothetical protein
MATFEYTVVIDVERVEGAHASNESIHERIQEALQEAVDNLDLDGLGPQEVSTYEVLDSDVTGGLVKVKRRPTSRGREVPGGAS